MTDYKKMLEEFQDKFEMEPDPELWQNLVFEEMEELLKEMVDLVYVTAGLEVCMTRIDPEFFKKPEVDRSLLKNMIKSFEGVVGKEQFNEAFKRVHESNLSKLDDNGKPIRREDGKIMKGPNYKPPKLSDLV